MLRVLHTYGVVDRPGNRRTGAMRGALGQLTRDRAVRDREPASTSEIVILPTARAPGVL